MADIQYKYDVFISYSRKDEDWAVNTLLPALENTGLKVCIDFRDFEAGKPAVLAMQDAAKESRHVVLVLTRNWLAGEWTLFEALITGTKDPAGIQRKLIPILYETGIEKDVPEFISMRIWVEYYRKDREAIAWKQLFTSLGKPDAQIPVASPQETPENTPASWFLAHPYGMPPNFTGRKAERTMLSEWLLNDQNHPMLILRALGGFGKSALTWHWLTHDVPARQFIKVVFWSFYEGDASFDNFVKETLQYLGVLNAGQLSQYEQTNLLLNYLRNPGILLILDGFERVLRAYGNMGAAYQGDEIQNDDSQDISRDCVNMFADGLLRSIGGYGGMLKSKILMTTRLTPRAVEKHGQFLQGVREEELRAMHKDDAVEFFHTQGIRGTHTEIEAACEPYGYHPLSLRILSGYIVNDRNLPGDIAAARHLEITKDIIQNKHHILEVGFKSLSSPQKKLLGRIACFRSAMDYEALKTLHGDGKGSLSFDNSLKILESRGFLHWDRKTNKYDLHPIVRRFSYDLLTAADRTGAHERLVNYFQAIPEREKVDKLEDLAPVIELYHHMVRAGNLDEAWLLFRDRIWKTLYYQLGGYQLQIELLTALFLDGENNPPRLKEEAHLAHCFNELANAYSLSGQPRRAIPLFEGFLSISEKMKNNINIAIGLGNMAEAAQLHIGALRVAESNLYRRIDLIKPTQDKFDEAIGHQQLGLLFIYCGKWSEAEKELNEALNLFQESSSPKDWFSKNWAYCSLLAAYRFDINNAKKYAQNALDFSELDAKEASPLERDFIRDYWLLGVAYRLSIQYDISERHLNEALTRCRRINLVDHEANILIDLARLRYDQKHYEEAKSLANEALSITERCGYVLKGADVNLFLAQYALEQEKDKAKAKVYAEEAKKLATCDGPPYYYKVAYEEAEAMLEKL
ncbi:MAG: TIR domain-containing protein [Anaerolineae bacterium]|nr:TIR domain-containing protein [Anaerolineae bacterium]